MPLTETLTPNLTPNCDSPASLTVSQLSLHCSPRDPIAPMVPLESFFPKSLKKTRCIQLSSNLSDYHIRAVQSLQFHSESSFRLSRWNTKSLLHYLRRRSYYGTFSSAGAERTKQHTSP